MRQILISAFCAFLLIGCASSAPVISKSRVGNLELNIYGPEKAAVKRAEIYIDGVYIGNATSLKPVLYIQRGERVIRVTLAGFKTYERPITILGDPNHQVLNVFLEKE